MTHHRKHLKNGLKVLYFYLWKLPAIYVLLTAGFIFEFITTFPFVVMTYIDAYRRKNS